MVLLILEKTLSFDNFKWIDTFFKLSSIGYTLWIIALIVKVCLNFKGFIFSYYPLRIYTTVLIYWLGYQGLKQARIRKERKQIRNKIINNQKNTKRLKKSNKKNILSSRGNISVTEEQYKKHQMYFLRGQLKYG